jgi:hypothetical protein
MLQRNLVLVAVFACPLLLVMGALDYQSSSSTPAATPSFIAQPIAVAADVASLAPGDLLVQAAARLAPEVTPWLIVKTWQRQTDEHGRFEAEGRLVRGPNQCARLETSLQGRAEPATILTVSDGVVLARAYKTAGKRAIVTADSFLTPVRKSPEEVEKVLAAHGCGGPHSVLKDLERVLESLQETRGVWEGKSVIRLTGSIKEQPAKPGQVPSGTAAKVCRLFLDAQTLWPHRVEWWAALPVQSDDCPLLELEFRDPQINQAMGHDDCAREFTYQPE